MGKLNNTPVAPLKPLHKDLDPKDFSKCQKGILSILSDGLPHHKDEFRVHLLDPDTAPDGIRSTVSMLRKKLRVKGHDIVCVYHKRRCFYQHIILLSSLPS